MAKPIRVILVECGIVLLNPATQIIVVEPACIDYREPESASMTRIIPIDAEDLPIGPLLRVSSLENGLERTSAVFTTIARPGPNRSSDLERHPATLGRLKNSLPTPPLESCGFAHQIKSLSNGIDTFSDLRSGLHTYPHGAYARVCGLERASIGSGCISVSIALERLRHFLECPVTNLCLSRRLHPGLGIVPERDLLTEPGDRRPDEADGQGDGSREADHRVYDADGGRLERAGHEPEGDEAGEGLPGEAEAGPGLAHGPRGDEDRGEEHRVRDGDVEDHAGVREGGRGPGAEQRGRDRGRDHDDDYEDYDVGLPLWIVEGGEARRELERPRQEVDEGMPTATRATAATNRLTTGSGIGSTYSGLMPGSGDDMGFRLVLYETTRTDEGGVPTLRRDEFCRVRRGCAAPEKHGDRSGGESRAKK